LSTSYSKILKKTLKDFKPDTIIFHYPNPFVAHFLLKQLKKYPDIKLVLYWHLDITKQKILGKLFNGQTKRLLNRAQKIVATSPNYIDGSKYLPEYKDKCVVIPNCVSDERMSATGGKEEEIRSTYSGKIICFALGRHVPYKGIEYLVRASKLLDDRFAILIGGQGELTPSLKELAAGDEKVKFLGKLKDEDVCSYLNDCDIFCFPSITKNEAFGIALAEAMAMGKPAVTFTIEGSGVNYVSLNGVTGIEVENGNVEEYAKAIVTLAENGEMRKAYGTAARERVLSLFTNKQFNENLNNLINGL
jgi:rhamnosyl/mannosyltransferase